MSDEETGTNNNSSAGGKGVGAAYLPFVQSGFNPSAAYKPVDIAGNVPNDELQKLGMTYAKNNLTGDIVWAGPLAMKETYIDANGQGGPLFTPVNGPNPQAAAAQAALSAPDATDASWFTNAGGVLSDSSKPQVGANDPSSPSFGGGTVGGLSSTNTAGAAYAPYVQAGVNPSAAYSPDQLSSNLTAQQLEQLGFTYAHNNLTGQDEYVGPIAIKETGTTGDGQTGPIWTPVNGPNPQAAAAQAALSAPDATDASWFTNAGGVLSDSSKPQVGANDPSSPSFGGGTVGGSTGTSGAASSLSTTNPGGAYAPLNQLGVNASAAYTKDQLSSDLQDGAKLEQAGFTWSHNNLTGQDEYVGPLALNETYTDSEGSSHPLFNPLKPNPQAAAAQAALGAPNASDPSWFTNAGGVLSDPSKPQVGANDPSSPSFGGGTSSTSSTHNSADTSTVTNVSPAAAQQAIISGGVEGYNQYAALGISPSYAYPTSSLTPEMKQQMGALGYQNLTGPDGQQYMVGPLAVNEGGWHSGGQSTPASTSLPGNSTFSVSAGNPAPVGPQTSTYTGTASHESANVSFAGSPESQEKSGSASAGGGGVVPSSTEAMLLENHEKRVDTDPTKIKKN